MYKKIFFILSLLISNTLFAEDITKVKIFQKSDGAIFDSKLECDTKFNTESFQYCLLELFHNEEPIKDAQVYLDGGMPAHAHGLPTAPKVVWSDGINAYEVEGLKFSMPGEWSLNFKVNIETLKLRDEITLSIKVD